MTPGTGRAAGRLGRRAAAGTAAAAVALSGFGLAGCGVVKSVNKVRHDVAGNKATIDQLTNTLKSGEATAFEATYVTTGVSPSTVVYAVQPPKGLAFAKTPSGASSSSVHIVANSSGEYSCSPPSPAGASASGSGSASWSCQKLGTAESVVENQIIGLYTAAHWVAFLKGLSLAASFAGGKVTSSARTVNGFSLRCVDFHAPGIPGVSTICTTAQGILGYVKIADDSATFEIKAYTASPPASLFELPAGAKVTTP